jgi:L,D-transpeptidase ErfK/SrfK
MLTILRTPYFRFIMITLFILALCFAPAYSLTYTLPTANDNIVGQPRLHVIEPDDSLFDIAYTHDIGLPALLAANPGINQKKLKHHAKLLIPTIFILPSIRTGIVINLAEMRLYYFPPNQTVVMTYPIGIGREGWETPLTVTYVSQKEASPVWKVPESIRQNVLHTKGTLLPEVVEPGPNNPLGDYALKLELKGYLIHGTNHPSSIGARSSSGCIRMYPKDIEELFTQITQPTPVYIIHEPYKLGQFQHELYLEAHLPLTGYEAPSIETILQQTLTRATTKQNDEQILQILKKGYGYPIFVGKER